ncbi:uncharacterized protein LOC120454119 [Drosophila santomea]|uniref:uncharacterized protein LOC120454119 n=1 Tax=Drosophila santomea TaxID=129105 RepID=UPI0019534131|nr:uncharacterized protein LOC120454119 [Drosophila santomea]
MIFVFKCGLLQPVWAVPSAPKGVSPEWQGAHPADGRIGPSSIGQAVCESHPKWPMSQVRTSLLLLPTLFVRWPRQRGQFEGATVDVQGA